MRTILRKAIYAFQLALALLAIEASASGFFEGNASNVYKKYSNGNEIQLDCGNDIKKCVLKTAVFGVRSTFDINFERASLTPSFDNIALMTNYRSSNRFVASFSVDCNDEQLRYMDTIHANGMICYASMEVEGDNYKWVVTESTPMYPSRTWEIRYVTPMIR